MTAFHSSVDPLLKELTLCHEKNRKEPMRSKGEQTPIASINEQLGAFLG